MSPLTFALVFVNLAFMGFGITFEHYGAAAFNAGIAVLIMVDALIEARK